MFDELDELDELIKTAMSDPKNWIVKYLNIKYHTPNTASLDYFIKGHKQIGYTEYELADTIKLSIQKRLIELSHI